MPQNYSMLRRATASVLQRSCVGAAAAAATASITGAPCILPTQTQQKHMSSSQQAKPPQQPLHATAVKLHSRGKVLDVTLSDGSVHRFSSELLRVCSPSAENCSTAGGGKVVAGRRHVGIIKVELVGNYALRLSFDDLHDTGIYTWELLHDLSRQRWSKAKAYLRALRAAGLSRNPRSSSSSSSSISNSSRGRGGSGSTR